jgi:exodeoxyribonuclease-5
MKLSPQQEQAYDAIMDWHKGEKKRFVLSGYAGSGKSTLAAKLNSELGNVHFCAYTGKAANVLREKGIDSASTLHGAIYKLQDEKKNGEPVFKLDLDSSIKNKNLVIVDEYSMLPEEIIYDLEKLAKKVLYLGDPFQLPPVKGNCSLESNFMLSEVHRQALDSPILRAATIVREGSGLNFCNETEEFIYKPRSEIPSEWYMAADQVIVGFNKTRQSWNQRFRDNLGFEGELPQTGEKLICLRNNKEKGLFNGMIDTCYGSKTIKYEKFFFNLNFGTHKDLESWMCYFKGELKPPFNAKGVEHFDFGYVITAHKAQGSEWNNVLVFNEPIGRGVERQRWLYTAITRSSKKCVLVEP